MYKEKDMVNKTTPNFVNGAVYTVSQIVITENTNILNMLQVGHTRKAYYIFEEKNTDNPHIAITSNTLSYNSRAVYFPSLLYDNRSKKD